MPVLEVSGVGAVVLRETNEELLHELSPVYHVYVSEGLPSAEPSSAVSVAAVCPASYVADEETIGTLSAGSTVIVTGLEVIVNGVGALSVAFNLNEYSPVAVELDVANTHTLVVGDAQSVAIA